MRIIPDIELPDELELPYRPELKDWIEDNLQGLRKVNVQLFERKNQWPTVATIEFFSKSETNKPNEKPKHDGRDILPETICELIMKIIQFDCEAKDDDSNKYRVQCIKNNGAGSITKAKHIEPPRSDGEEARFINNPSSQESLDLLPSALSYIERLQDMNLKMMSVVTEMITPLQMQNSKLQEAVMKGFETRENIKRMEIVERLYEREKETELEVAKVRTEARNQNIDKLLKYAKQTGIGQQLITGLMNKINGGGIQIPQESSPPPPPPPPPKDPEADMKSEMENSPIKTLSNALYTSILEEDQEEDLKNEIGELFWNPLYTLMNSNSEQEAKINIQNVKEIWEKTTDNDKLKIMNAMNNNLNETQQKLVGRILEYIM